MELGAFSISLAAKDLPTSKEQGIEIVTEAGENTLGPASFVIRDPDGTPILINQHV
jgi:hypothetical protein